MSYKEAIRQVIKEANKRPHETLKRIAMDKSLNQTEFKRYKPNKIN